jgi:hypothetical protein
MDKGRIAEFLPDLHGTSESLLSDDEVRAIAEKAISTTGSFMEKVRMRTGEEYSVSKIKGGMLDAIPVSGTASVAGRLADPDASTGRVEAAAFKLTEGTYIRPWRNTDNINAKVLDVYDGVVLVECLVDRENKQYAEMEFSESLFSGYEIAPGKFCVISKYERENTMLLEINANPSLDLSSDFPSVDWAQNFKNSQIFK